MSPDTLRVGAILVADAHCAPWRPPFADFLIALEEGRIVTPQLVLMGDIFDLLFGPIPGSVEANRESVDRLNRLAERIEIVYLEGNHDFLLCDVFPGVRVIAREAQPWMARSGGQTVALSHGDRKMGWGYEIYTALIRNRMLLWVLNRLDQIGNGFILRYLERSMKCKNHCKTIEDFEFKTKNRLKQMDMDGIDVWIEGHFHQNRTLEISHCHYINLAAFACNERYFTVQSTENEPLLRENAFRKESL